MRKALFIFLPFALSANLAAFELQGIGAAQIAGAAVSKIPLPAAPLPENLKAAPEQSAVSFAAYKVNGVDVVVPNIGGGNNLLAVLSPGTNLGTLSAKLRPAFAASSAAKAAVIQPQSKAELELAARNPGAAIVSLNSFLPAGAAALFNREPNFAGPNCFNAAFTAAGMMEPGKLRHVGNPEADQLLSMYYKSVPASNLQPGDILVLNDGDHGVYYLGGGLIFHKKSYLKQHLYRIALLEKAYEPEPNEWKPGIFDGGSSFSSPETIHGRKAWRPSGAHYDFGQASADESAKADAAIFITGYAEKTAPNWALAKEMGYFTERLLENLVDDWSAMAKSPNPVLRAYYHQLESLRDQANQSIEVELLSSQHAQANANEILKRVWLPRNDYSRGLISRLLKIYGRDQAVLEKVMDAIEKDYDGRPLSHIKSGRL
ncbi:MAG: hypothetical protein PHV36_08770 [Elusimicrobiales bacterium]|nr:hypothetical protein [Elusimicrobiales bacterium]